MAEAAKRPRLDSKLEAAGAEFLVLGNLLIEGIQAYQAYTNQRDYDIVATGPESNTSARIQVKSRWATDSNKSFPISKLGCDFVVFAVLNRGVRYRKVRDEEIVRRDPDFFVVPIEVVTAAFRPGQMSVVRLRDIPEVEVFLNDWGAVRAFLTQ